MPNPMDKLTTSKLIDLGIKKGMKVLDFGCGGGVTSFMLSELVGSQGEVVGHDINSRAIEMAKSKLKDSQVKNINFMGGDLAEVSKAHSDFDFVFARRVLMYISNPVEVLINVRNLMNDDGIIVFQEHDSNLAEEMKELPLHERIRSLAWQTVKQEGGNITIGEDLESIFKSAGFNISSIEGVPNLLAPESSSEFYVELMTFMKDRMLAQKMISPDEFNLETLGIDLKKERASSDKTYTSELAYWICAQK